jgi:putative cell wall-binding protein
MSNVQPRGRRALAAITAAAMLSAAALIFAPAAHAAPTTDRLSGLNRYATAVAVANAFGSATHVVVASGQNFPDAMTAAGFAGSVGAPILLTDPNTLSSETKTKLEALPNPKVTVVGGTGAVSAAVFQAIDATTTGAVNRLEGGTRYETACAIANAIGSGLIGTVGGHKTAVVATGLNYPDALTAGVLAAEKNLPVYLVSSSVPACVTTSLTSNGIKQVIIAGGEGAVSASVETQLETTTGNPAIRYGGANRNDTAAKIADGALASFGFDGKKALLAYGRNFPDALAAGPYGALTNAPILLTSSLPPETSAWLQAHASTLNTGSITAIGGTGVIPNETLTAAATAATPGATTNATYSVTPTTTEVVDLGGTTVTRQYSASVPSGTVVSIRLFSATDITNTGGTYTFLDADSDNLADQTANAGRITVVNGVAQTAAQQIDDITSGGTVTFTIGVNASTAANVIPVVWADPTAANGGNNRLNLTVPTTGNANPKTPSETFGVGGRTNFVPGEATLATHTATVTGVDLATDFFTASGGTPNPATYYYDSNDIFQRSGAGITMAQFEGILSVGDVITAAYNPDASGVSTFNMTTDSGPAAPTGVSGTVGNFDGGTTNNDVRVTYTKSTTEGATQTIRRVTIDGTGADDCTETGTTVATGHTSGTFTDNNPANGTYNYCVKAVQGSGSVTSSSADVATGNQVVPGAADTAAPTTFYVATTTDSGFANEGDSGDVMRFIFNEPVDVQTGDKIRLLDGSNATVDAGEEQFDITNGTGSTWSLNTTGVSIGGTSYAAGRVLTISLTANPTPIATVTGGNNRLDWPATVFNQSGIQDLAGNNWDFTTTDRLVNLDTVTPAINTATGSQGANQLTLTYNTLVACTNDAATRAQFVYKTANPTAITCNNTATVVLTFAGGVVLDADDASTLTYTQSATTSVRIQGLNGRDAQSPQTTGAVVVGA